MCGFLSTWNARMVMSARQNNADDVPEVALAALAAVGRRRRRRGEGEHELDGESVAAISAPVACES
jgi:hypothetical protein